ncbi:MAG: RNA polymerase subunit sigma [Verrucomicrobia bacterium]|nr:MAG: RNA polymerase subunit sigma [Verrucomicrobiota bacterium]
MLEPEKADAVQGQLLRRVATADRDALAQFYDETAGPLFSLALRIVGDAGEAEEVVQDTFVQIWKKAATFDPALGSAFHWAMSIARHRAIDRLRARQRRARLIDELEHIPAVHLTPQTGSDEHSPGADELVALRAALTVLPEEQRQAIELAFFGGHTHTEIAEALHQPLGTIKARIRRGMLKLRDSLQAYA